MGQTITLDTKLGTFYATANDAENVYITSNPRGYNVDPNPIRVNRVDYIVTLRLSLIDGEWNEKSWQDLYMSRINCTDYNKSHASFAAKDKVRAILIPAWREYVGAHPEVLEAARTADIHQQITQLEQDVARLEDEISAKRAKVAELVASL